MSFCLLGLQVASGLEPVPEDPSFRRAFEGRDGQTPIGSGRDKGFMEELISHTVLYEKSRRRLQTLNLKSGLLRLKERIMQKLGCLWEGKIGLGGQR